MFEGKYCQTQVTENASFTDKSESSQRLLHRNLRDRRKIEVRVMRHYDAVEQNRHDPREMTSFRLLFRRK